MKLSQKEKDKYRILTIQHFCLENPMDGGSWWATVHRVTKSQTQLNNFTFTFIYSNKGMLLSKAYFVLRNYWMSKSNITLCISVLWKWKCSSLSCVWLFVTPWTVACQTPVSMEFSRKEYWSGLSFASPGDLPDPEIEPKSPVLQLDSLLSKPPGKSSSISNLCLFSTQHTQTHRHTQIHGDT